MNAYFELFGSKVAIKENDTEALSKLEELEEVSVSKVRQCYGRIEYNITPSMESVHVKDWIDKVVWAIIECFDTKIILKSTRTLEDEEKFLKTLQGIEYDAGYGLQQLFGVVVFKDGSWLSRGEYDGSEWWEHNKCPKEPDWDKEPSKED